MFWELQTRKAELPQIRLSQSLKATSAMSAAWQFVAFPDPSRGHPGLLGPNSTESVPRRGSCRAVAESETEPVTRWNTD